MMMTPCFNQCQSKNPKGKLANQGQGGNAALLRGQEGGQAWKRVGIVGQRYASSQHPPRSPTTPTAPVLITPSPPSLATRINAHAHQQHEDWQGSSTISRARRQRQWHIFLLLASRHYPHCTQPPFSFSFIPSPSDCPETCRHLEAAQTHSR